MNEDQTIDWIKTLDWKDGIPKEQTLIHGLDLLEWVDEYEKAGVDERHHTAHICGVLMTCHAMRNKIKHLILQYWRQDGI